MLRKYPNPRARRRARIKYKIHGTQERPRLSVFRSNRHLSAQLIDDDRGVTLVAASDLEPDLKKALKNKSGVEAAQAVGKLLAKRAAKHKIAQAVFDRSGYRHHGRVKALAEAVREGGVKI